MVQYFHLTSNLFFNITFLYPVLEFYLKLFTRIIEKLFKNTCIYFKSKLLLIICIFKIRSFFWSIFSCIWTEYGDLVRKSPYSVRIQENTDQKNSVFGHFSRSITLLSDSLIVPYLKIFQHFPYLKC